MLKSIPPLKLPSEKVGNSDDLPEKDIQLLIELEMDDEVKDIINFPEKYADTFLDVTVIKPKSRSCTTEKKIMSGEQVKDFITSMNLGKAEEFLIHAPQETPKSAGDFSRIDKQKAPSGKVDNQFDIIGDHFRNSSEDSNSEMERTHQIYTTPRAFTELNSLFECKNKKRDSNEKSKFPCFCQNCAILGVVADSQKKLFSSETSKDPSDLSTSKKTTPDEDNRKKRAGCLKEDHHQCHCYFKHLNEKIRALEDRLAAQEQKSVPKEYFRKIITKLLSHVSKMTGYGSQINIETTSPPPTSKKPKQHTGRCTTRADQIPHQRFTVNPLSVHHETMNKENLQQETSNGNSSSWNWSENILRPGIDLKNKMISVMEDTLSNLKKSPEKPREEDLKHFINEFSNNLYKSINDGVKSEKVGQRVDVTATIDFNKISKAKHLNRKMGVNVDDPLSVTYINSHVLKWQDTQTTFKFESDKESTNNILEKKKVLDMHKQEFVKTIKNTKDEDKRRLWQSIWNQACKNGHSKIKRVTVQIPDKKNPKNKSVEVEYSLGELEYLLLGPKISRK